jgi:F-type H+-transporting ATPase subunit b
MLNIRSTATAAAVWLTPVIVRAAEVAAEAEHGGHGEGEVNLLKMDYGTAIFTLIIFIGLVIVLGKFVWPQIVKGLDVREAKIREDIESAERANAAAQKTLDDYKAKLAEAHAEARKLIDQTRADADTLRQKMVAEAEAEAAHQRERAAAEIVQAKNQALQEIYTQAADIAVAVAGRILQRQIDAKDTQQLVDQSLSELGRLDKVN